MTQTTSQKSDTGVALEYFEAWSKKDYDKSGRYLDDNLSFVGPIDTFSNAKDYLEAIRKLGQILVEVRRKKAFVDGGDVCFIYDLVTNTPAGTVPCAEWIHADNGKVRSIRVYFDARPFAAMFGQK